MVQQPGPVWTVVGGLATATTFFLLGRKTTTTTTTPPSPSPAQEEQAALTTVVVTMSTAYHGINDSKPTTEMLPAAGQRLRGDEPTDSSCAVTYEMGGVLHEWGCPKRKPVFSQFNTTISDEVSPPTSTNITASGEAAMPFTDTTLGFFVTLFFGVIGTVSVFCLLILLTERLGIALETLAGYIVWASEAFDEFQEYCIDHLRIYSGRWTLAESTLVDLNEELRRLRAKIYHHLATHTTDQEEVQDSRAQQARLKSEMAITRSRLEAEVASQQYRAQREQEGYYREMRWREYAEEELDRTKQEFELLKTLSVQLCTDRDSALYEAHHLRTTNEKLKEFEAKSQLNTHVKNKYEAMTESKVKLEEALKAITQSKTDLGKDLEAMIKTKADLDKKFEVLTESKFELEKQLKARSESKPDLSKKPEAMTDSKNDLGKKLEIMTQSKTELEKQLTTIKESKIPTEKNTLAAEELAATKTTISSGTQTVEHAPMSPPIAGAEHVDSGNLQRLQEKVDDLETENARLGRDLTSVQEKVNNAEARVSSTLAIASMRGLSLNQLENDLADKKEECTKHNDTHQSAILELKKTHRAELQKTLKEKTEANDQSYHADNVVNELKNILEDMFGEDVGENLIAAAKIQTDLTESEDEVDIVFKNLEITTCFDIVKNLLTVRGFIGEDSDSTSAVDDQQEELQSLSSEAEIGNPAPGGQTQEEQDDSALREFMMEHEDSDFEETEKKKEEQGQIDEVVQDQQDQQNAVVEEDAQDNAAVEPLSDQQVDTDGADEGSRSNTRNRNSRAREQSLAYGRAHPDTVPPPDSDLSGMNRSQRKRVLWQQEGAGWRSLGFRR
ncbi:hypothetical protein LTR78_005451 [Recurvomyces mirabilis]|uniref:Uncharacterized protein n=1 Tax=Recurvomyces mirabilis TaxID=574656 RepID=A0AAE1C1M5_9PEZI|nr:hypothetical protein LTR78_005451 [Recurvomyces mirabilis]KAK5152642.1 hypothetical protein LTS14_008176 [Recurvomyces mirabilis]